MNTKILENIGLTNGEINVYISLLEIGETTTGELIKKSNITGSKVYEILNKLIKKGLASYIIKKKNIFRLPHQKESLISSIKKKRK